MTLQAVADGLEARLATVSGLRVFDHIPDTFATPCAFVLPADVEYWGSFTGGNVQQSWTATVVVGRTSDRASQRSLNAFMGYDGATSIRAAIEADRTLGGACDTCIVTSAQNIRMLSQGDASYLAVDFSITVHV